MATGPVILPPGTVVLIAPNGANVIQEGQGDPSTVMQPPGMVQYVGQQQFGSPRLGHQQTPPTGLLEKLRKVETKTLGTIQIIMGLIHIGLGVVSIYTYKQPDPFIGGYPLWGGAFFIISGSLSVSAENRLKIGLVKSSVGFNTISAMLSLIGFILYCTEFSGTSYVDGYYSKVSTGLCGLLLMFSMLECGITCLAVCFDVKLLHHHNEEAPVFMPYTISGDPVAPSASAPPNNDTTGSYLKGATY